MGAPRYVGASAVPPLWKPTELPSGSCRSWGAFGGWAAGLCMDSPECTGTEQPNGVKKGKVPGPSWQKGQCPVQEMSGCTTRAPPCHHHLEEHRAVPREQQHLDCLAWQQHSREQVPRWLPAGRDVCQQHQGERPRVLAGVCYGSPSQGTKLRSKTILLIRRGTFLPPLIISHAIPGGDLRWEGKKKIPFVYISFIQLPILKPLARMSHIYTSYHIILCSVSAATCLPFLTIRVC